MCPHDGTSVSEVVDMRMVDMGRNGPRTVTALVLVGALALTGCGRDEPEVVEEPTIEVPTGDEAPTDGAVIGDLTTEAATTVRALRDAAAASDWDAVAALVPSDGFTADFGGTDDPIALYRSLPEDVLAIVVELLDGDSARIGDLTVWPALHARVPFTVEDAERPALEARFGAEAVAGWEAAGAYLGWRIGIQDDGTWRFLVAGD